MIDKECSSGKCDLRDQTSDKVLEFMESNDQKGFGLFLFKDSNEQRGYRKDITKDISYNEASKILEGFKEECIAMKFIPYGYDELRDKDVAQMVDGPIAEQIKKLQK